MKLKGRRINFLGDDITFGQMLGKDVAAYPDVFKEKTGAVVRSYGVKGSPITRHEHCSNDFCSNLDFCMRAKTMNEAVDTVVVFGGLNDYLNEMIPLGTISDDTPYTFYGALKHLINVITNRIPGVQLIFVTPLHCEKEEYTEKNGNVRILSDFVNAEKEVCCENGISVIDFYAFDEFDPRNEAKRDSYTFDGIHPCAAGHRLIGEKFAEILAEF